MNNQQKAKQRAQSAKERDWSAYVDNHKDLSVWHQDGQGEGLISREDSQYEKLRNRTTDEVDGMEQRWVDKLNKYYGTQNTDMNQFSKEQFGEAHYHYFGQNEKRKDYYKEDNNGTTPGDNNGITPGSNNQNVSDTGDVNNHNEVDNTQTQVNDISGGNNTVNGDNNTINQDFSQRQYGGDNRQLNIQYGNTGAQNGGGSGVDGFYNAADMAVTMGTLGGFYDVDDSAAARGLFRDQSITGNRDAQKRYAGQGLALANKYTGFRGGNMNAQSLQYRIDNMPQWFDDKATIANVKAFGDRDAKTKFPKYNLGAPIKPVTSNAAEAAEDYKDDIEDL